MTSTKFTALICALTIGFTASAALAKPHQISRKISVDKSFADLEVSWQSAPPSYKYKLKINVVKGIVEVCGVGVFMNSEYRSATTQILRKQTLEMNGKPILRDFMFMARVSRPRKLKTAFANCVSTGVRFPKKQPEFNWGRDGSGRYRID